MCCTGNGQAHHLLLFFTVIPAHGPGLSLESCNWNFSLVKDALFWEEAGGALDQGTAHPPKGGPAGRQAVRGNDAVASQGRVLRGPPSALVYGLGSQSCRSGSMDFLERAAPTRRPLGTP